MELDKSRAETLNLLGCVGSKGFLCVVCSFYTYQYVVVLNWSKEKNVNGVKISNRNVKYHSSITETTINVSLVYNNLIYKYKMNMYLTCIKTLRLS